MFQRDILGSRDFTGAGIKGSGGDAKRASRDDASAGVRAGMELGKVG